MDNLCSFVKGAGLFVIIAILSTPLSLMLGGIGAGLGGEAYGIPAMLIGFWAGLLPGVACAAINLTDAYSA